MKRFFLSIPIVILLLIGGCAKQVTFYEEARSVPTFDSLMGISHETRTETDSMTLYSYACDETLAEQYGTLLTEEFGFRADDAAAGMANILVFVKNDTNSAVLIDFQTEGKIDIAVYEQ